MFLGTIIWVILCGSVFLMGGILFTFAVFKLIHSTLYIGVYFLWEGFYLPLRYLSLYIQLYI